MIKVGFSPIMKGGGKEVVWRAGLESFSSDKLTTYLRTLNLHHLHGRSRKLSEKTLKIGFLASLTDCQERALVQKEGVL